MKLTLGQASKEAGISKPSLSAAIKKGRLSAAKNESGVYEIDPAELFRVYPKKTKTNMEANSKVLPEANSVSFTGLQGKSGGEDVLNMVLAEHSKLIAEKDRSIARLEREKEEVREDLTDQKEQNKRITVLITDQQEKQSGAGEWEKSFKALESRIANQEKADKEREEREQKLLNENERIKRAYSKQKAALEAEKNKSFFQKLFG